MAAFARLQAVGSFSWNLTEEVDLLKLARQYKRAREDEVNVLHETDMHVFGLRPMTDPLDLVCCNHCKKPIKASQYRAHSELCKSQHVRVTGLDRPSVTKKPRMGRKGLLIVRNKQATPVSKLKRFNRVDSADINPSESTVNVKIRKTAFAKHQRGSDYQNGISTPTTNGSESGPCDLERVGNVTSYSSKPVGSVTSHSSRPLTRITTESLSNLDTKSSSVTTGEVPLCIPVPLATKIYYSQRNHDLRRAIRDMFYDEPSNVSYCDASNSESVQANVLAAQTSSNSSFDHEQDANKQEGDHPNRTADRILHQKQNLDCGYP